MANFVSSFEKWGSRRCRFRLSWHYLRVYMCTCNSHKTISICYELSSYPIFTNSLVSFFNSKFYVDFSFFRFWSPQVWGLICCTTYWSIGCIPWKTSLENQAVIFSSTGKLSEFFRFNFNLFVWLPFATFAFFMMIFYSDSVWVLEYIFFFSLRIQNQNFSWKSRQLQLLSEQYIMPHCKFSGFSFTAIFCHFLVKDRASWIYSWSCNVQF